MSEPVPLRQSCRPNRQAARRSRRATRCDLPPPPLAGGDPRDDRVGGHRLRVGVPVPHVRGRGVCHSHRLDGADVDGTPQGPGLSEVRLSLPGQRERGSGRGRRARRAREYQIVAGTCPMCRYTADWGPTIRSTSYPSYNGDRILVGKFAYEFGEPQRWDVIVFKYPGDATTDARTNFIKRLVGLPGETVRIQHGDMWIRRTARSAFHIARKPPEKLLAMLQPVFDNDYMPRIAKYGWPARWQPEPSGRRQRGRRVEFRRLRDVPHRRHGRRRELAALPPSGAVLPAVEGRRSGRRAVAAEPRAAVDHRLHGLQHGPDREAPTTPRRIPTVWACIGSATWRCECTADVESDAGRAGLRVAQRRAAIPVPHRRGHRPGNPLDQRPRHGTVPAHGDRPASAARAGTKSASPTATTNCGCGSTAAWCSSMRPRRYDDLGNTLPDASDLVPVGVASAGAKVRTQPSPPSSATSTTSPMSYAEHQRFAADDSRLVPGTRRRRARCRETRPNATSSFP